MKIIQFVGYKNSGKTTWMNQMIHRFSENGYIVGSLKHHGHGGLPDQTHTDSAQHQKAGAMVAGVEGEGVFQLSIERNEWQLDELIDFYRPLNLDILLIEGFKQASYEKIVLLRDEEDRKLLDELDNIIAVVSPVPIEQAAVFENDQWDELFQWLKKVDQDD